MDDMNEWDLARVLLVLGITLVLVFIIGGVIWRAIFFQPYQESAFNSQVQGLITEYCTAPRVPDQEGARQQLIQLVDGKPDDYKNIPTALHNRVQLVYENNRNGACA